MSKVKPEITPLFYAQQYRDASVNPLNKMQRIVVESDESEEELDIIIDEYLTREDWTLDELFSLCCLLHTRVCLSIQQGGFLNSGIDIAGEFAESDVDDDDNEENP